VEVTLDPAQLGVLLFDRAGARGHESLDTAGEPVAPLAPAHDVVDAERDRQPEQYRGRPEVAAGRDRPDRGHEEEERDDRTTVDRQAARRLFPGNLLDDQLDERMDREQQR
jgi:hypothetical protein